MAYLGVLSGRVSTVKWPICMSDGASEVQGECRAELARAMLSRSLHSRCISNAAQRYDIGIAVHEYSTRIFSFSCITLHLAVAVLTSSTTAGARHSSSKLGSALAVAVLTSSTTAGARHSSSKLGSALAVAVVAVLQFSEKYSHAPKICSIFIYINIEFFLHCGRLYFELQHCNNCNSEHRRVGSGVHLTIIPKKSVNWLYK